MPRKSFNCDQRRAMTRHIAGVFKSLDNLFSSKGEDIRGELLSLLIDRARPIQGMQVKSEVHGELVKVVFGELIEKQGIHINEDDGTARMSPKLLEKEMGKSRMLKQRAARDAAMKVHPAGKMRRCQEVLVVLTA